MSAYDARNLAQERELDLVKIAPNSKPPVCKIMNYGKYKFELAKKEKEARKKQKIITVKEIRLRPNIEDHDLNTKANNAIKFLKSGDKVKVAIRYRGRELGHKEIGYKVMERFMELLKEYGDTTAKAKFEGNSLVSMVEPLK